MEAQAVRVGWIYNPKTNTVITDGLITWSSKYIDYVGKYQPEQVERGVDLIYYPKSIMIPPFINGHTHLPETLLRGLIDDVNLETWLYDHVWQVEPQMNREDAKIGTTLGIAELISSGSIGFIDQFYYSNEMADVVSKTGVKAFLAPSIFDNNPETKTIEAAFAKNKEVYKIWNNHDERISIGFGPHALYSIELDDFKEIAETAREYKTKVHTHVLETAFERKSAIENWGKTTLSKFDEMNIMDVIVAAHCVHVDDDDIKILEAYNTNVLHNLQSNMKLGSGVISSKILTNPSINVLIGTDGNASNNNLDMLEEIRFIGLIQKAITYDPIILTTNDVMKMATVNASKILENKYHGTLEKGKFCDFTVFDLNSIMSTPIINPISNLHYSILSNSCVMTVSNGEILYKEGNFKFINIEEIKNKAQKSIDRMMDDSNYTKKY